MNYSIVLFFSLFVINNLLHQISEKVIITVFVIFLFALIRLISRLINSLFEQKIGLILNDVRMYMDSLLNFLYLNKIIFINLKRLILSYRYLFKVLNVKTSRVPFLKDLPVFGYNG